MKWKSWSGPASRRWSPSSRRRPPQPNCLESKKGPGLIQVGMEADFIVVDLNPLDDIVALQDVVVVVTNGRVAINHLEMGP